MKMRVASVPAAMLEDRVTHLERRMSAMEGFVLISIVRQVHVDLLGFQEQVVARFDALENKLDAKFDRLDARLDRLDAKVSGLDAKFGGLDTKFDALNAKLDAMPRAVAEIVTALLKKT